MIYIEMEMPEKCSECRFETQHEFCKAMPDNFCGYTKDEGKPEWCPLKEQEAQIRELEEKLRVLKYGDQDTLKSVMMPAT